MKINRITFVLALVLLGLLPSMAQAQAWYGTPGWSYRKAITIDFTKVSAGPHANYPVLISRADTDLRDRALSTGNDILFTSSNGTTKLSHEIESYTSASGTIVAWVEIPSLSSSANTVIYMYYGNAAAGAQQDVVGTWDASFKGVWHLNNAFLDATSNNADGTNTGSTNVTGKISNGRGFVRSDGADFIQITGLMGSPTSFTLSAWATLTTPDTNAAEIISLGDNSVLRYDENSANRTSGVAYTGAGVWTTTGSAINYAGTGWHYVVYTFDNVGNSQKLYIDGIQRGSTTATATPLYTSGGTNTFIGKHGNANVNMDFDGTIDEVRVANASRSVGWVLTEFNNQNAPSTFATAGTEAKTYYSLANGNWSTASTWSNISHTGAAASTAPGSADYVIIGNSDTVTLNVNFTNQAEVEVNSTGTLNMGTNTISGAGPFTLNSGGTLGIGSTVGITSSGATGNVQVTGTRTFSTAANYNYDGSSAQVTGNGLPATVNNLTSNNGAGVTFSGAAAINGTLTLTSGALSIGANTLTVSGPISTTSGSLTGGGTSNLTIGGAGASTTLPAVTLNNLTMNRANGLTMGGNVTASGVITLTSGNITTAAYTLNNSTGTVSRTSGHVIGNFKKTVGVATPSNKTFELGDAANYTPVTIAFASVTTAGDITTSVDAGDHTNIGTSTVYAAKSVNRNWTITNSGTIVFTNYGATFTFVAGDLDAGANTSAFIVGMYSAAAWTYPTVGTKTGSTTQTTGLTTFGDFQLGEVTPVTRTWDGGAGTNNWGDANNWSPNGVPISTESVNLTGANTININVAAMADSLLLNNAGLTLTINAGSSIAVSSSLILTSGTFNMGTNTVSGAGSFTLGSGSNLGIGSTAGITSSGATGNVQVAGTRTFSTAGNYTYNGSGAQATGNGLPATVNNLTINNSAGVTQSATVAVSSDLTITSGVFTVGAVSLAVTGTTSVTGTLAITSTTGTNTFGDLVINSGGTFANNTVVEPISIAGNLQNDGTFNQGTGRVTFTGATSNTVTGSAASTAFGGGVTVDKGVSNANVLDVHSVITMLAGGLTLTNGTFKLSSASTITPFTVDIATAPYLIPSTAGLWCNGGTMNSPAGGMAWNVKGLLRVSAGTVNAGNVIGNFLAPQAGATIVIEGGDLNLADRISQIGSSWTYNMTGGTLTVAKIGSATADRPPFNMDQAASSFSMSGGTIIVARQGGSAGQNLGYFNAGTAGAGFTGGTLQIGDGSTPAASTIGITSTNAIYNLTVNAAGSTARPQTSALTITNAVTLSAGTLNSNSLGIFVGGDWNNNASTTAFTPGTATVTFNGAASGTSIGGSFATTFNGLTMNRANGVSLGANTTVGGILTFTSGNITTGANALYVNSAGTVSRTSGHVIGNFQKNVATGAISKTFEVGDANYAPVTIAFASVTTAGDLTARTTSGDHANIGASTINASKTVNRNWSFTNSGIAFTNYAATFTFVAGDVDAGASTSAFVVGKYSAGWTYPIVGTRTSTSTQATGLTAFGDFQLGEAAVPPNVALVNSVSPSGTQPPGTDLVYTVAFTNDGGQASQVFIVIDPIPAYTDFKLGSATTVLGTTGMTVVLEYSNDNAATWTYTPVSGGGGAPANYDRSVTHVRWRFTGNLSQTSPNNTGSVGLTAKIR